MLSRNDGNIYHPESPNFLQIDQNRSLIVDPVTKTNHAAHVIRSRNRRSARLTTDGGNDGEHLSVESHNSRSRRHSIAYGIDSAQPTSSPKSTFVLEKYVASNSLLGSASDGNSFSSRMFSEHLVSSELPLDVRKVPDSEENVLKPHHNSVLSSAHDLTSDDEDADADEPGEVTDQVSLVNEIKSGMSHILLHAESGASISALVSGDDGSSEGEDAEDDDEQGNDSVRHREDPDPDGTIASESDPLLVQCGGSAAINDDELTMESLAVLSGHSTYNMVKIQVDENLQLSNPNCRLLSPNCDSPTLMNDHLSVCASSRMVTRSQTIENERRKSTSGLDGNVCSTFRSQSSIVSAALTATSCEVVITLHSHSDEVRMNSPTSSNYHQRVTRRQAAAAAASSKSEQVLSPPVTYSSHNIRTSRVGSSPTNLKTLDTGSCNPRPIQGESNHVACRPPTNKLSSNSRVHPYPLRSRLKRDSMRKHLQAAYAAPKSFNQLPSEVLFRIIHYLSIQDVFRLQLVNRRLQSIVEHYLLLVKRINFSNGLPFAFLSQSITDVVLKRILTRTPEVTHILGFYPKIIGGSNPADCHSLGNGGGRRAVIPSPDSLTYGGIITAFRHCAKLRSVELMDVELMSKLVHYLPRIKFHGMFRNRPDSWDSEFAVPLPTITPLTILSNNDKVRNTAVSVCSATMDEPQSASSSYTQSPRLQRKRETNSVFVSAIATLSSLPTTSSRGGNFRDDNMSHPPNAFPCTSSRKRNADFACRRIARKLSTSAFASKLASASQSWSSNLSSVSATFDPVGEHSLSRGSPSSVAYFLPFQTPPFTGPLIPWHQETPSMTHFTRDAARAMFNAAPFLQPGIPPLEVELIPAYSFATVVDAPIPVGLVPINNHNNQNNNRNTNSPVFALAFNAVFIVPRIPTNPAMPPSILLTHAYSHDGWRIPVSILHRLIRQGGYDLSRSFAANTMGSPSNFHPIVLHASGRQLFHTSSRHVERESVVGTNRLGLVSPLPCPSNWIGLPHAITNLTKLDLVSVTISSLPRLDNIKYLQLKWVVFASNDPFFNFSASKLQSFVMNNCCGQPGVFRFVRMFSALARAPQLSRLELVGVHFVDGLLANIIDISLLPGRGFRNLQRLVLASNKDSTEFDVGLLMMAGQQSLNYVALQLTHTQNSLFESLWCSQTTFPRLEHLILGYQDPYQSRLTASELLYLGMGESSENLMRLCTITDWGLSLIVQHLCPRLGTFTIRHAPYLSSIVDWGLRTDISNALSSSASSREMASGADGRATIRLDPPSPPLRSLTLENCPGISIQSLEEAITSGSPFPCLETLVLRDMFVQRSGNNRTLFPQATWKEQILRRTNSSPNNSDTFTHDLPPIDWCRMGLLHLLSEYISFKGLTYPSRSFGGIGLSSSVRDVLLDDPSTNRLVPVDLWPKPFDLFHSLRVHHYLNCLLELDGSCGPQSIGRRRILDALLLPPPSSEEPDAPQTQSAFKSQATQTCVCGQLEWHMLQSLSDPSNSPTSPSASSLPVTPDTDYLSNLLFAFHPYPPSMLQQDLFQLTSDSEWSQQLLKNSSFLNKLLSSKSNRYIPSTSSRNCLGCKSDPLLPLSELVSSSCIEPQLTHRLGKWLTRDASVDTTELRSHASSALPLPLTVYQPQDCLHRCLTSLHFENVGLSHIVICGAPQLKNITLENCPLLQALLFTPPPSSTTTRVSSTALGNDPTMVDLLPCLRRIRVIRCPKFAIYHLLHSVASLYPSHDENISITYRPFGHYDGQVERALWSAARFAHVLISHDYKKHESERQMEEFHSSFDQIFREVINFTDMLIRRELLTQHPRTDELCSSPGFRRSEHGFGWDMVTDIPWIHEICCSILRSGDTRRSEQTDQFYEILSELQSSPNSLKLQHRGIHLHVQYRDVHRPSNPIPIISSRFGSNFRTTYHKCDYSEAYISSVHPLVDYNAWGDQNDETYLSTLPSRPSVSEWSSFHHLTTQEHLLLAQEEDEVILCTGQKEHHCSRGCARKCRSKGLHRDGDTPIYAPGLMSKKAKLHDNYPVKSDHVRLRSSDIPIRKITSGGPSSGLRRRPSVGTAVCSTVPDKIARLNPSHESPLF